MKKIEGHLMTVPTQPFDKCPGLWAQKCQKLHRLKKSTPIFVKSCSKKKCWANVVCITSVDLMGSYCVWAFVKTQCKG